MQSTETLSVALGTVFPQNLKENLTRVCSVISRKEFFGVAFVVFYTNLAYNIATYRHISCCFGSSTVHKHNTGVSYTISGPLKLAWLTIGDFHL